MFDKSHKGWENDAMGVYKLPSGSYGGDRENC